MERRKFLSSSCNVCLLLGAGWLMADLTACSPAPQIMKLSIANNSLRLPLTVLGKNSLQILRPEGWVFDIALRKKADGSYEALFLQCTHQKNQVIPDGKGFLCTLHGSRYSLDGEVTKGPAEQALKKFPVHEEAGELVIRLIS